MAADLYSDHKPIGGTAKNIEIDPSPTPSGSELERSASDATSCISSVGHVSSSQKEINAGHKMSEADYGFSYPTAGYYGYYYPGYDGYSADSNAQAYVPDVQYPVMQADAGSYYYFFPGSGYSGYDPQMPIGTVAVDGQYFGQQLYQPSPVLTPTADSCGIYPTTFSYGAEYSLPSYAWDSSFMVAEGLQGSGYAGVSGSQGHGANQLKPPNKVQGPQHDSTFQLDGLLTKGHHPKYPFNHQRNDGVLYSSNPTNSGKSGKPWDSTEKTKLRSKASAVCDLGHTNGKKYDSRASFIEGNITRLSVDGNGTGNNTTIIRRDQYNLPDFLTKYDQALFFVIKSYSEDDIHKSIKYNVWASTSNGNKRLDSAYLTAQEKAKERGSKCPVFLFFSVNASGQFCGVAEMVGRVNFDKSMDFWQQDKWNGYFPVKWHIIKDVSNQCLRHIILENNDNKPVTNSRDTQEVYFSQGIELLNTFKSHPIKTSILDDFGFYESREKIMQSKRTTPPASHFDHMQKKVDEITSCINSIDLQGSVKPGDPVAGNMGED